MGSHALPEHLGGPFLEWRKRIGLRFLSRGRGGERFDLRRDCGFVLGGRADGNRGLDPLQDPHARGGALGEFEAHLGRPNRAPIRRSVPPRRRGRRHAQHPRQLGLRAGRRLVRLPRQRPKLHGLRELFEHVHHGPEGAHGGGDVLRGRGAEQPVDPGEPGVGVPAGGVLAAFGLPRRGVRGIGCERRLCGKPNPDRAPRPPIRRHRPPRPRGGFHDEQRARRPDVVGGGHRCHPRLAPAQRTSRRPRRREFRGFHRHSLHGSAVRRRGLGRPLQPVEDRFGAGVQGSV